MLKCDCNFIEITLQHGSSPVNLMYILRTPFPKSTSGGLLLTTQKMKFSIKNFFSKCD